MPAETFLADRVNSSPASPAGRARLKDSFCLKGFFLNAAYYLLQPEEGCVCVWGGGESQDLSDIKAFPSILPRLDR